MNIPQAASKAWAHLRSAAKLPGFSLVVLVVFSFAVGESYPFSPFPMYSGLGSHTLFLYLADGEGNPVAIKEFTGQSASALNKLYGARLDKIGDAKGMRSADLPAEDQATAGREVLDYLRRAAESRGSLGQGLPETLRLVRVDMDFQESGKPPGRVERVLVED